MNYLGFVGPSSTLQTPFANCERLMNLYLEPQDSESGRPALYGTPGFRSFVAVAAVGGRALFTMNGRTHAVMGGSVQEVFQTATATNRGAVLQDGNLAYLTTNGVGGNQLGVGSGGNFYSLNLTTNVLSAALLTGECHQLGMLDGYGVMFNATDHKMRISELNDFTTLDPTQFAIRSSAPDNWQAMCVNPPDVWLIGGTSGDVWYDAGAYPFPFAPRPGASFPYGIAAAHSIAAAGDSVLWLAQTQSGIGPLVRARGYTPQPVGSIAFNTALAKYQRTSIVSDAESLVAQFNGNPFFVLRFPSANATWAYDLRTGQMFELSKWHSDLNRDDAWAPRVVTTAFGKQLVGDATSGTIAEMDETFCTELDGSAIRRLRIPPALDVEDGGRGFVDRFELKIQGGVGTAAGQGVAPVAEMRVSHDYGQTWGNARARPIGPMGATEQKTFWLNCGSSEKSWVPEIVITDPVPVRIVGATFLGRGFAQQGQGA